MRRTIREKEPVRPSTRLSTMMRGELTTTAKHRQTDAPKLISLLRGDLDWIVMKCLEKDRTRRYETANGLAADLHRFLLNEPVVARPPTTLYQWQKAFQRNRLVFGAAATVVMALGMGIVASTWQAFRANRNATLADAESVRALAAKREATANLLDARQNLYAANMNLAHHALEAGDTRRARKLLERYRPSSSEEDLRGFEWHYLWRLSQGTSRAIIPTGATNSQSSVAFSPDGKTLAMGNALSVQVWDLSSRRTVGRLEGHRQPVRKLAFSPDGRVLASIDTDARVILWDFPARTNLATFEAASPSERLKSFDADLCVAFFPSGQVLATSGARTVKFWNTATGLQLPDPVEHVGAIGAIAISRGGTNLAIGDVDGTVVLWNVESKHQVGSLTGAFGRINGIAFSPDDKLLAAASFGDEVGLWDLSNANAGWTARAWRASRICDLFARWKIHRDRWRRSEPKTVGLGNATTGQDVQRTHRISLCELFT